MVAALAWVQPIVDQFAGEGNLGALLRQPAGTVRPHRARARAPGSSPRSSPSRRGGPGPGFSSTIRADRSIDDSSGRTVAEGDVAGIGPACSGCSPSSSVLAVVIVVGWRRRHRPTVVLGALAAVAVGGALLSMMLIAGQFDRAQPSPDAVAVADLRLRPARPGRGARRVAPGCGRAVVPVGAGPDRARRLANLPTHAAPRVPPRTARPAPTVAALVDQLSSYEPDGPVLFDVSTLRFAEPYSGPVLAALARNGVDVVVADEGMVRQLGERRRADGDETAPPGPVEGAATRIRRRARARSPSSRASTASEQAELDRLRPEVLALARRDGLRPQRVRGRRRRAGRIPFERTVLAPGADPPTLDDAGWISTLVADGYLAPRPQRSAPPLPRYSELDRRFSTETVGLFELPLDPSTRGEDAAFDAETGEVDSGADRLPGTELGSADVGPLVEGDLEHRVGADRLDGSVASGEAEEELDIERPPTAERFAQRRPQRGSGAKDLGPALGVVHLQSEHQAARGGEDAAEVVAAG